MSEKNPFSRAFWRSPRPPHAFVLGRDRLVYVGPQETAKRKAALGAAPALRVVSRSLPEEAFVDGPGDIPVAGPAVAGALQRLLAEVGVRIAAACLVVPDGFAKLLALDVEDADAHPRETEDVVAWKFGRTFGEPAPPLRLSWLSAGPGAAGTRVLALAVPEPAAASWEAPFEKAGIRIGALETGAFAVSALAKAAPAGESFLVWADGGTATALFFVNGALRFARTRPVFGDADEALHEIRLAASYLGNGGGDDLAAPCTAGPEGSAVVEALDAFRRGRGLAGPSPLALRALVPGASVAPAASSSDPAVLMGLGALAGDR
ncbi:MAG TPA: hypothetical protein VMV60_13230 [Thermoanaerobaculia bacterium]|nr:hypothetical protein [Thermoanaerobaculia bacterium]